VLNPQWVNLARILFAQGRDAYERATLEPAEYRRRQDERTRNGCIGCLTVLALVGFALLAITSAGR
jgi:hypothetical protein